MKHIRRVQAQTVASTFTLAAFLMGGTFVPIPYALRCAGISVSDGIQPCLNTVTDGQP